MEKHFMVDIETTGVNKEKDKILEVGIVEIEFDGIYWNPTGRVYHRILHYPGQPETEFAKKHMAALYKACNEQSRYVDHDLVGEEVRTFIHRDDLGADVEPKYFMGWNASNFDVEFMFKKNMLTPSYYVLNPETGKEELRGNAHYRIYEQTGSLQLIADSTGFSRNTLQAMAMEMNPTGIVLPEGKQHDALYDCYKQIIMQNGLIKIARMGLRK